MSRHRICLVLLLAIGVGAALLLLGAPGAEAKGVLGTGIGPTVGPNLNPLPSIGELLNDVVNGVFGALLSALTPRYAKSTIDGALSALSAVLGYAMDEGRIETNVAYRMRIAPDDPLLDPIREQRERRYIPPDEFAQFFKHVKAQHRAVCLAPLATGCRTQELLGLERSDLDNKRHLVFVHQRARVLGGVPRTMRRSGPA